MSRPFIGITDFTNAEQVRRMLTVQLAVQTEKWQRRLAVGVMMSWKTLHGQPTKWSSAFPSKEAIADIFLDEPGLFNVLHYADYDGHPLLENLEEAVSYCGPNLHGIQLDMIWPDLNELKSFKADRPHLEIILQGNSRAMAEVGNDPDVFARRLAEYGTRASYVLLDKSGGKGLGMDALALLAFANEIKQHALSVGLAAAGGLGPHTLHLVEPLLTAYPETSIDAQGRLRPSGNALDPLDMEMCAAYLNEAARRFG